MSALTAASCTSEPAGAVSSRNRRASVSSGQPRSADATAAVGTVGANGHVDTKTLQQPITSFTLTNVGLEAGVSVGGSKITPISLP